jgi:hypothetical protein
MRESAILFFSLFYPDNSVKNKFFGKFSKKGLRFWPRHFIIETGSLGNPIAAENENGQSWKSCCCRKNSG